MADKHAQQLNLAQIEVNKAEAASGSFFKGGWRPAVGWVCAVAFAYHFILKDLTERFLYTTLNSLLICLTLPTGKISSVI